MSTFLHNIAADLLERFGHDMSRVAVVFPNKRASLFLNQELAALSTQPLWAPTYITISELFCRHSDLTIENPIALVCRLHEIFVSHTGFQNETLDNFYGWGQLLISDFDDLDKNMASAKEVFSLVENLHAFDDADFLNDKQREALRHFFNTIDDHSSRMREKFLALWTHLYDIYTDFRESLRSDGVAYEGMMYRDVIDNLTDDSQLLKDYDTYCFVGFNMLQRVEQRLFRHLSSKALYYWDYDESYLKDDHEAGHFIKQYLTLFPNAIGACDAKPMSDITYISCPTENMQGRYATKWLDEKVHRDDDGNLVERYEAGRDTAIIMCDEKMLQTLMSSLPDDVSSINITTGYPLSQTQTATLLPLLIDLQTAGRMTGTDKYRLQSVVSVLRHPYGKIITDKAVELTDELLREKRYYPSRDTLCRDDSSALLFCDIDSINPQNVVRCDGNLRLLIWMMDILKAIAMKVKDPFESESLFKTYQILGSLHELISSGILIVDIITMRRLLTQIVDTTSIPFHGEPIEGIQVMGVLETRGLDFKHILLLSCNEGNMPKGEGDSSFIPHSVRRLHGMTTVENKVGIYSYYFHRLMQRCDDITIAYNSSTEGMNSGEMSRFMLQMMVESPRKIRRVVLQAGQITDSGIPTTISKTPAIISRIHRLLTSPKGISPSSLAMYMRCKAKYFYTYISGMRQVDEELEEEMNNMVFGNIFHKAAQLLYENIMVKDGANKGLLTKKSLEHALSDASLLQRIVDEAFAIELFKVRDSRAFHPEYNGLQLINRRVVLRLLRSLIRFDLRQPSIRIVSMEQGYYETISIPFADGSRRMVRVGGLIDRLDIITGTDGIERYRVIDYKTGSSAPKNMKSLEDVFHPSATINNHEDYFLQAMLYSHIICTGKGTDSNGNIINADRKAVSPQLLFIQQASSEDYSSVLSIEGEEVWDFSKLADRYQQGLSDLIHEITDPITPFAPNPNDRTCKAYCPFYTLCIR